MPLNAIHISVTEKGVASYISDILFELGALSVNISDLDAGAPWESPIYDEPQPEFWREDPDRQMWNKACITALFPLTTDMQAMIMMIATHFDLPETPTFSISSDMFDEKTPDDWVRQVQGSFKPVDIGRVRISFPWHERRSDVIDIRLEPGIAFGTGEHPTTQLCLSWLQRAIKPGATVLDFGCGTGVLAIAATMLARDAHAVGVDLDPQAVKTAIGNATINNVNQYTRFFENQDEPQEGTYDIVLANILAKPLVKLAPHLVTRLNTGGFIALSGLLTSQAPQLVETYAQLSVSLHDAEVRSGWALLVGVKR